MRIAIMLLINLLLVCVWLTPFTASASGLYLFGAIGPASCGTKESNYQYDISITYQLGVGNVFENFANVIIEGAYIDYDLAIYDWWWHIYWDGSCRIGC